VIKREKSWEIKEENRRIEGEGYRGWRVGGYITQEWMCGVVRRQKV
jgi:hypothetical protein